MGAIVTNSAYAWVLASRPKTLGAICCPVLIGTALAWTSCSVPIFLCTLLASVLLQILANLINDYGDFIKGSDSHDRLGPPRAMQMGFITNDAMVKGIVLTMIAAIVCGCPLVVFGGAPIFAFGISGIGLALWYTLGDRPLAYRGYVEIIIFAVFGPGAVAGSYYLQTRAFSYEAVIAGLSPGFLSTALILTNNLRDLLQDRKSHKFTTAVRLGERCSRFLIILLIFLASASPLIFFFAFPYGPIVLLPLFALVLPLNQAKMILTQPISRDFNIMLASLGKALYLFGLLSVIGIVYGAP